MKTAYLSTILCVALAACTDGSMTTTNDPDSNDDSAAITAVTINDGSLIYRRILSHSHVDEQPFTRSGGPVAIQAHDEILVRAHMNSIGYGNQVFRGSVAQGLVQDTLDSAFSEQLETTDPLPSGCAF